MNKKIIFIIILYIFLFSIKNSFSQKLEASVFKNKTTTTIADSVIDCSKNNFFEKTLTTDIRFSFSNFPTLQWVNVFVANTADFDVLWDTTISWEGDVIPTQSEVGKLDIYRFIKIGNYIFGKQEKEFGYNEFIIEPSVYYVSSTDGDDNNTGLDSTDAFRTLSKLTTLRLYPGDTIRFKGGDNITGTFNMPTYNTVHSANDNPIVLNSYGSGKSTLTFSDTNYTYNIGINYRVRVRITISNLIFKGLYDTDIHPSLRTLNSNNGIKFVTTLAYPDSDSTLIIIDSCEFSNYRDAGLSIGINSYEKTGRYLITSNYFHDIGREAIFASSITNSIFEIRDNIITNITGVDTVEYWQNGACGMRLVWCHNALIERNYLDNIGTQYLKASGGIYINGAKYCTVQYNEIRNVRYSIIEGAGIYFDCGSDNNRALYNLIINCNRGMYISPANSVGDCQNGQPPQTFEDTLMSSNNVAAYNVIIVDSGGTSGISSYNTGNATNRARHTFIFNNFIMTKRSHDVGKSYYPDSAKQITAINAFGYYDSIYIYNNILVIGDSTYAFDLPFTRINTINPISYNNQFINGQVHNNIFYFLGDSIRNSVEDIGTYYYNASEPEPFNFYYKKRFFVSLKNWADSTMLHKNGSSYTYLNGNPSIKRLTQNLSQKINPWFLDTLTAFQFNQGSIAYISGINNNSELVKYSDTLTTDWYGTTINYLNPSIGIYEPSGAIASGFGFNYGLNYGL